MNLEGISITYPDTDSIYNGLVVQGYKLDEIIAVNNLKYAWQFVLDNIEYPTNYPLICKTNQYVGGNNLIYNSGFLRIFPANIGGTTWKPDMPIESQIKENLEDLNNIKSPTDRAITLMLYCMRKQIFTYGNKSTAMIANGEGILSIPIEKQREFTKILIEFYETNKIEEIKHFVYENGIDGIEFLKEQEKVQMKPFELEP